MTHVTHPSIAEDPDFALAQAAAIVESSDDAIISKDLNGVIQTWNPGAERVFGYTADEMIGQPVLKLIPQDRCHEEEEILARLLRRELRAHDTLRHLTPYNEMDFAATCASGRRSAP